jgi:hypothetical protein
MKMFLDHADHSRYLFDRVAENPSHVMIASYGIYAGISYAGQDTTQWGEKFRLATRDLMEVMRPLPDVRFLIGASAYRSCKGKFTCIDCEKQYCRTLIRFVHHAELFPEFQWRITTNLHLKACLFFYAPGNGGKPSARGVGGGRNFSDSDWVDCTFELPSSNIRLLYAHIKGIWDKSKALNDETIGEIFEEQEISERGFKATLAGIETDDEDDTVPF